MALLFVLAGCTSGEAVGKGPAASGTVDGTMQETTPAAPDDHVPNPMLTVATGGLGRAGGGLRYDVTEFGYQQDEYLFAGTAKSYPPLTVPPAAYASRMIVWTPKDPSRFSGTTVVEWAEVSDFGQFELTVDLSYESQLLEQRGDAFVLVSAQQDGVCQPSPTGPNGCTPTSLKGVDLARYGTLHHPGDAYSFNIFSQALQAIKHPNGTAPLGTLRTRTLIAEGFQASADKYFVNRPPVAPTLDRPFSNYGAMNAYLSSGADDDAQLADAFLIDGAAPPVEPTRYRVPTLHYLDESAIRWTPTPDTTNHVTWEVTGAPHVDRWGGDNIKIPSSTPSWLAHDDELTRRETDDNFGQLPDAGAGTCAPGPHTGDLYPRRFTLDAAVADLVTWATGGRPAPSAARIDRVTTMPRSPINQLSRDGDGNATGGLRSPIIQVPVATYAGNACIDAGTTTPFSPGVLTQRHPTHRDYVEKLLAATNTAIDQRFLLCPDAQTIMAKASASNAGGDDTYAAAPHCS